MFLYFTIINKVDKEQNEKANKYDNDSLVIVWALSFEKTVYEY